MVHSLSLVAAAGLVGSVLARTSSVGNLFLPGFDGQGLVAKIIAADATSTEYFVQCDPNGDSSPCRVGPGATVTMRPHTYDFDIRNGDHLCVSSELNPLSDTIIFRDY